MKHLGFIVCIALVCCNCKNEPTTESFSSFYERFHNDSLFQISRVQFPLEGLSSKPEAKHAGFRWERENWLMHKSFDEKESGFKSEFSTVGNDLVIEHIIDIKGRYGMERRFSRLSGNQWHLIYYADLHPL